MKVKCLSRNPDEYIRETKNDLHKMPRNYNPELHPFEADREYVRATVAAKKERIFAKPYLASLQGHTDSIISMMKNPNTLVYHYSGDCDGIIKIWDLPNRKCVKTLNAHSNLSVRGMAASRVDPYFYSVGDDKVIRKWNLNPEVDSNEAIHTIISKSMLVGIDHHYTHRLFATCGEALNIWDEDRNEPLNTIPNSSSTLYNVKFNPVETHILASTAMDRSIHLYDIKNNVSISKLTLSHISNTLCWNPTNPSVFTVANEDFNLYTFDIRYFDHALQVHEGHVGAVTDVDYSPTGLEFVSGSYDKTVRIFPINKGRSREIYHTQRMQRINRVSWTLDNKYILSSSNEAEIRLWKAKAHEKFGYMGYREKTHQDANEALKEKFAHHPAVRSIMNKRHVPKHILNEARQIKESKTARKIRESNKRSHSKPGTMAFKNARTKFIVKEKEEEEE